MSDAASTMGVNFSNLFMVPPVAPAKAAQQIAQLPVRRVKTFSHSGQDLAFIQAAAALSLRVAVGIPNNELQGLANGQTQALIANIKPYASAIDYLCVGNEPLGTWYNGAYTQLLVPAMQNVQKALQQAGLPIGVTCPQNFQFMSNSYPPSAGTIDPSLRVIIGNTCKVMQDTKAPFMVNLYPFLTYLSNPAQIPLDYCLFNATPNHWVHDGPYVYKNIFDAMLDALYVALGQIGYGSLPVVVGECGWPTQGAVAATTANARLFNQNLIAHCKSGSGTPRRPGQIPCYIFEMYDEAKKSTAPGPFEVAWGVYTSALQAKYALTW